MIGNGAAAFSAAIRASEITSHQAKIAMIGYGPLGGTCVNVGCVPSKYLIKAASAFRNARDPLFPGISSMGTLNFKLLVDSLRDLVNGERKAKYEDVLSKYENVEYYSGYASFINDKTVAVTNGDNEKEISAYNFLIATGSRPSVPRIKGIENSGFLTSNDIWSLEDLPSKITVLGAGAVGLELGQAFLRLGSEVTVVEALPHILYGSEPEVSETMLDTLKAEGIKFYTGASVERVEKAALYIKSEGQVKKVDHDTLLVATGRTPNLEKLALENAGVEYSAKGIKVNEKLVTSNPRIYAAGDVVDQRLKLETVAAKEGAIAAENMYEHAEKSIDLKAVPFVVFTDPQVASVGLKESECQGCTSKILPVSSVAKARIIRKESGIVKMVVDKGESIRGVHVVSPYASEIIIEGVYAIKLGLTVEDIIETAHVFPTISESIKLAAQSFRRDISMMSCCVE
ncbi:MAG: mercury(II) reductase [Nitrososphaeria archaeon]